MMHYYHFDIIMIQAAAERLHKEAARSDDNPGPVVEAAKKIAIMWKEMGELLMY